jgi:hypothetical protein
MSPLSRPASFSDRVRDERGIALIISLFCVVLMMALGMALMLTTVTETKISSNYSSGNEALYAADAAVERVMQDLLTVPDWNNVLGGTLTSSFIDGAPTGQRTLADGTKLDLQEATYMVRCGKITVCSDNEMNAYTEERPWGTNNPRWQLYAYGSMDNMLPTETINSRMYVLVWVADDPSENDALPLKDGEPNVDGSTNSGKGVVAMLAHAYGPNGVKRVIEVTLARTDSTEIERGYTGQRGQDEQNRRARKAAVQTPGKALTRSEMSVSAGGMVTQ